MQKYTIESQKPIIVSFFQPYPVHLYPEDEVDQAVAYQSLDELQAALFRKPPTAVSTPGKMRPGGFNRSGKMVPSKWIPAKMDQRSGK